MNLFDLAAKITLDSSEAESGISSFGDKMKSGLQTAAKVGAAAMAAASVAAVKFVKDSVQAYSEYEQLVGGVETLFGTGGKSIEEYAKSVGKTVDEVKEKYADLSEAENTVMQNAANAYKTAGMSANEYMDTVTSFAASLVSSVGGETQRAASLADLAIRDMSDNANKMGTSIDSIKNAYQGFAKQNYTMLDNLKLGYGGTKSEMERLIRNAEKLDETFKVTHTTAKNGADEISYSYADIVKAINVVQTNMGITGTTAKEASETISGSLNAMSASWQNLITGMADENANFDELVNNFVDSASTAAKNILPRIKVALQGIGKLVTELAPVIADAVPTLINDVLPGIIQAAIGMIAAIGQAIIENAPAIYDTFWQLIDSVISFIAESGPSLIESAVQLLVDLAMALTDPTNLDHMLQSALTIIQALADGILRSIPVLLEALPQIINNIVQFVLGAIPQITKVGFELFMALVEALPDIIVGIVEAIPEIILGLVDALTESLPQMVESGFVLFVALIEKLPEIIVKLVAAVPKIIESIVAAFVKLLPKIFDLGVKLLTSILTGIINTISSIAGVVGEVGAAIRDGFAGIISNALTWGKDLIDNFVGGIKSVAYKVGDAVKGVADKIKGLIGFSEPEDPESPLHRFHTFAPDMMELFAKGVKENTSLVTDQIKKSFDFGDNIVSVGNAGVGFGGNGYRSNTPTASEPPTPITIIVQSVLDRRVIGETAYNYALDKNRVTGG